jgi:hypothetical protein
VRHCAPKKPNKFLKKNIETHCSEAAPKERLFAAQKRLFYPAKSFRLNQPFSSTNPYSLPFP